MGRIVYTDETLMRFGKFKGAKLGDVPDDYLMWLYDNATIDNPLRRYIKDSFNLNY